MRWYLSKRIRPGLRAGVSGRVRRPFFNGVLLAVALILIVLFWH
jgi:hypothetical protein